MKTKTSSPVFQPVTHCFLLSIPMIFQWAIVPLPITTNVGEVRIIWKQFLMGMNVRTRHLQEMHCNSMYLRVIQNLGVVRVLGSFWMNCTQVQWLPSHSNRMKWERESVRTEWYCFNWCLVSLLTNITVENNYMIAESAYHCKPKTPLHFPYTRERTECKVGIREIWRV